MTPLANPWITINLSATGQAADRTAAALNSPPAPKAAAEPIESSSSTGGDQEAPAVVDPSAAPAGATDLLGSEIGDVGEIFIGARKLEEREISLSELEGRGFDVHAFMDEIEPLPLFLQAAQ
jgi:hypothetical protein